MVNFLNGSIADRINYIKAAKPEALSKDVDSFINYDLFEASNVDVSDVVDIVQGNITTSIVTDLITDCDGHSFSKVLETAVTISVDGRKVFKFSPDGWWEETTYNEKDPRMSTDTWDCGRVFNTILLEDRNMVMRTSNNGWIALFELDSDGGLGKTIWNSADNE